MSSLYRTVIVSVVAFRSNRIDLGSRCEQRSRGHIHFVGYITISCTSTKLQNYMIRLFPSTERTKNLTVSFSLGDPA